MGRGGGRKTGVPLENVVAMRLFESFLALVAAHDLVFSAWGFGQVLVALECDAGRVVWGKGNRE
jgi:hypothetical protein